MLRALPFFSGWKLSIFKAPQSAPFMFATAAPYAKLGNFIQNQLRSALSNNHLPTSKIFVNLIITGDTGLA